jgi:lauroyl/myristoyl acyltransferase
MDLRSRVPSVVAPFLGRPASTAVGPARIALRTGAGVVVGTAAPVPGGVASALSGGLQITVTRIELGDGGASALTARINDELSRRILAMPQGWVWMHPRWTP